MTTQTQDTHPQDPIERFTLRIEGLRRMPVPRGVAGIVHMLFVEFFIGLWTALAGFAEHRRNGTLAEVVPVEARETRAWPAELRPRDSGWVEHRGVEDASGGATMREQVQQLKMPREIIEPIAESPAGPAFARPLYVHDGCWPRSCGPGVVWTTDIGLLRLDSKKSALAVGDTCVQFVTI